MTPDGRLHWAPTGRDRGVHELILEVQTEFGVDRLPVKIDVACAPPMHMAVGCSTTSQMSGLAWMLCAVLALLRRRARAATDT